MEQITRIKLSYIDITNIKSKIKKLCLRGRKEWDVPLKSEV